MSRRCRSTRSFWRLSAFAALIWLAVARSASVCRPSPSLSYRRGSHAAIAFHGPAPTRSSRTFTRGCWRSAWACWPASLMRRRTGAGGRARRRGNMTHVTTGLWFSILVGVALVILEPALRRVAVASAIVAIVVGVWALVAGPLRTSMAGMDDVWLQAVSSKDSLFASQWPVWAWLANLALLAALWWAYRRRSRDGQASREDTRSSGAPRLWSRSSSHTTAGRGTLRLPGAVADLTCVLAGRCSGHDLRASSAISVQQKPSRLRSSSSACVARTSC